MTNVSKREQNLESLGMEMGLDASGANFPLGNCCDDKRRDNRYMALSKMAMLKLV